MRKNQNVSNCIRALTMQETGIKLKTQFGFTANVLNNLEKPVEVKCCTCLLLIWGKKITAEQGRADGKTANSSPAGNPSYIYL